MQKRSLPGTSLEVTPVNLGTMIFGEQLDEAESHYLLDVAVKEHGINMIDTAELYPVPCVPETSGKTDKIIGSWLAQNPSLRPGLVITTKVIAYSQHFYWYRGGPKPTAEQFHQSIDDSLKRLGIEQIDLFLIHWPARNTVQFGSRSFDPSAEHTDLDESGCDFYHQALALSDAIKKGKIKHWGLSNETTYGVMKFLEVCRQHDLPRPCVLQNAYSLLNRTFEVELWEACYRENISLLPYSSLAMGHLTGKYLPGRDQEPQSRLKRYPKLGGRYQKPHVDLAVQAYSGLAAELGVSLPALALAYVHQRPFVASNIIGVRTSEQLAYNLQALQIELSAETLAKIDEIHHQFPSPTP